MATAPRPGPLANDPLRDLVLALHELHRAAGKPGTRRISTAIRDRDDLRDTVSHETIREMLRGSGLPKWVKVECVVRQLADWAVTQLDADREVRRFHQLWLAADDESAGENGPVVGAATDPVQPASGVVGTSSWTPRLDLESPRTVARPAVTNLPIRRPHFTGRTAVLEQIRATLTTLEEPPLCLVGLAGVGKTQLAVEYLHRRATAYDVVWWVPAEQPSQAIAALAALGEQLRIGSSKDMRQTVRGILTVLETSSLRWALVYDNADKPDDLDELLPAAGGHVIVTTRNAAWTTRAANLQIDVFTRDESIGFLRERGVPATAEASHALAEQLGDLPLALDQVCAMQTATGMPVAEYLRLFAEHFDELLAAGRRAGSRATVSTSVKLAVGRLRAESAAANQLLELLAFLAPTPVPVPLLHRGRDGRVAAPLGRALHHPDQLARIAEQVGRYGLAHVDADNQMIQVHRLVQLVVREALDEATARARRRDAHRLLAAANPGEPDDSRTWPQHGEIGPHLIASAAVHADEHEPRQAVLDQVRYLERVGDFEASVQLARGAVAAWRTDTDPDGPGPDDIRWIQATRHLANALRSLGWYEESRNMIMSMLELLRASPHYGRHHPVTLATAEVAAFYLRLAGSYREALAIDRDRVEQLRRQHGDGHPTVLSASNNLTINLRLLGAAGEALKRDTELVQSLHDAVGSQDQRTSSAVRNQAWDLLMLGRYADAVQLQRANMPSVRRDDMVLATGVLAIGLRRLGRHREALERATENYRSCQDRFGPDHHLTLASIMTYANTLRAVGDAVGARSLATEALDRYRRLFGGQNPLTLAAATNLAVALRACGQWREAYRIDEVTLDETVRVLGADHPQALVTAVGLATDLARHGDDKDAVDLGRETLARLRRVRGPANPETLVCALNLALDSGPAGRTERDDALDRLAGLLGPDHPDVRAAADGARLECDIEPPPT